MCYLNDVSISSVMREFKASLRKGFDGVVFGDAMSRSLCEHFCNNYQALHLPSPEHIYRIMFPEDAAKSIREVYSYEWTEDII